MDVEALREAARSGKLAVEPDVIKPPPTPGEALEKAMADLSKAFAKTVDAVKATLDEAWFKLSGEEGPPGYGTNQLLIAIAGSITERQTVPTAVGPVEVRIPTPTMDAAKTAMKKLAEDVEVIARTSGMSVPDVEGAVRRLEAMAGPLHDATGGTVGPAAPTTLITSRLDAMEMFGEGALYADGLRVGVIVASRSSVSASWKERDETKFTIEMLWNDEVREALIEVGTNAGKMELWFGSDAMGVVKKVLPLGSHHAYAALGAAADGKHWEVTVALGDEA